MTQPNAPAPSRRASVITWLILLLAIGGGLAAIYFLSLDEPHRAVVGDCVAQTGKDAIEIVDCGDSEADFTVVGRLEGKNQIEAGISACNRFDDATSSYWQGEQGEKGTVLCLAKKG